MQLYYKFDEKVEITRVNYKPPTDGHKEVHIKVGMRCSVIQHPDNAKQLHSDYVVSYWLVSEDGTVFCARCDTFESSKDQSPFTIELDGIKIPFGSKILVEVNGCVTEEGIAKKKHLARVLAYDTPTTILVRLEHQNTDTVFMKECCHPLTPKLLEAEEKPTVNYWTDLPSAEFIRRVDTCMIFSSVPGLHLIEATHEAWGVPVGMLYFNHAYDGSISIMNIVVVDELRRKGIARKMIQDLQDKYPGVQIVTQRATDLAKPMLEKIGFSEIEGEYWYLSKRAT